MERTPPTSYGSDPDLSRYITKGRKRKPHEMESCSCVDNLSTFKKWQQEMMTTLSETIKNSVDTAISAKFDKFSSDLDNMKSELKKISADKIEITDSLGEIKNRLCEIEASAGFSSSRQDNFDTRLASTEQYCKKVEQYEIEIAELKNKCSDISVELRLRQQWDRLLNLEIVGVPESHNEDLIKVVTQIAKHVDVTVYPADIEFATRIQAKRPKPGTPRTIIAKLKNRTTKDNILAGVRRFRGITRNDIGLQGSEKIFVNEHLTLENKDLYSKCRSLAATNSYKYVWIRNCSIFVRRDDKSPKIAIKKDEDLKKIK